MNPFLTWTGGKRWLVQNYPHLLPRRVKGRYIEPFFGGGTMFFSMTPQRSILSDLNSELITTYKAVKENYNEVVLLLKGHESNHSKEYYYLVRSQRPVQPVAKAARLIYLNRTCFNGIYRVNLKGEFNVPIGTKSSVFREEDDWAGWSAALGGAELVCADFEQQIEIASKGDFLFVDPPYTVRHNYNGFIKYNEKLFSWSDQERLADALEGARKRGARILITNANHQSVKSLYKRGFNQQVVSRYSSIAASGTKRAAFEELIITANVKG
ncbi:DNA adenine methylase [Metapseudomonas otitidis]|uniref:DNA adenine methylase n=1 Tax=Metapseudomonas otitidis TaxID=319939 RepID=UPI00244982C4|nr:Dam family site-specific DNA-(adenine-N6)-methyltransferase [Pseudomonas otitidis]MDG9782476.1 Dam family site-specific DNA-(adenine-N6)-methyltransferase [Pseudomonas otitidis]MDH0339403.1 Dam family site-specific DNA-(adenine-N6)-methyltransferase [Pseudomonas otitidis]